MRKLTELDKTKIRICYPDFNITFDDYYARVNHKYNRVCSLVGANNMIFDRIIDIDYVADNIKIITDIRNENYLATQHGIFKIEARKIYLYKTDGFMLVLNGCESYTVIMNIEGKQLLTLDNVMYINLERLQNGDYALIRKMGFGDTGCIQFDIMDSNLNFIYREIPLIYENAVKFGLKTH